MLVNFLKKIKKPLVNIGSPVEMTIKDYAKFIRSKIDPNVILKFDNNKKLDGVKRKKIKYFIGKSIWVEIKDEFFKSS